MHRGIILYGPPGSGKDTVTSALVGSNSSYALYPRLKCGPGRTAGYRMISSSQLATLRAMPGEIIYENQRYRATYAIDRSHLLSMALAGIIPIVHLGQVAAVEALTRALPGIAWLVTELRCARHVAADRIRGRATGDTAERLSVYEATVTLRAPHLIIDTDRTSPTEAANAIESAMSMRARAPAERSQ